MWSGGKKFGGRGTSFNQRTSRSAPSSPINLVSKMTPPPEKSVSFHALHKVPAGDSPYVKAKHVQLVDRDPNTAISLFWSAINTGDRVDSALKDMAVVMKQVNRTEEAIEAIKSFRHLCSSQSQESLDNVLLDLYKRCGRIDDQIELLQYKLVLIERGLAFGGRTTKVARSQGKKFYLSLDQERSRLLGNLAWAYMQQDNYQTAEALYRKALSIEPDNNKQCNLAICLMQSGKTTEAKALLQCIRPSSMDSQATDSYVKSFERACTILSELESDLVSNSDEAREEIKTDVQRSSISCIMNGNSNSPASVNGNVNYEVELPSVFKSQRHEFDKEEAVTFLDDTLKNANFGKLMEGCYIQFGSSPFNYEKFKQGSDFSSFSNTRWVDETGVENFVDKNQNSNKPTAFTCREWKDHSQEAVIGPPAFINGNWKLLSSSHSLIETSVHGEGKRNTDSLGIIGERRWADCPKDKESIIDDNSNSSIPIEPQIPAENSPAMIHQKLSGNLPASIKGSFNQKLSGNLPASIKGSFNQGPEISFIGSRRWSDLVEEEGTILPGQNLRNEHSQESDNLSDSFTGNSKLYKAPSISSSGRTWAEMVEEDEEVALIASKNSKSDVASNFPIEKWEDQSQEQVMSPKITDKYQKPMLVFSSSFRTPIKRLEKWGDRDEAFSNENMDSNIIRATPPRPPSRSPLGLPPQRRLFSPSYSEKLRRKLEMVDLKEGMRTQNVTKQKMGVMNSSTSSPGCEQNLKTRRSLSFDMKHKQDSSADYSSALQDTVFKFEDCNFMMALGDGGANCGNVLKTAKRGNRLRVFQEITLPDSPKAS